MIEFFIFNWAYKISFNNNNMVSKAVFFLQLPKRIGKDS